MVKVEKNPSLTQIFLEAMEFAARPEMTVDKFLEKDAPTTKANNFIARIVREVDKAARDQSYSRHITWHGSAKETVDIGAKTKLQKRIKTARTAEKGVRILACAAEIVAEHIAEKAKDVQLDENIFKTNLLVMWSMRAILSQAALSPLEAGWTFMMLQTAFRTGYERLAATEGFRQLRARHGLGLN